MSGNLGISPDWATAIGTTVLAVATFMMALASFWDIRDSRKRHHELISEIGKDREEFDRRNREVIDNNTLVNKESTEKYCSFVGPVVDVADAVKRFVEKGLNIEDEIYARPAKRLEDREASGEGEGESISTEDLYAEIFSDEEQPKRWTMTVRGKEVELPTTLGEVRDALPEDRRTVYNEFIDSIPLSELGNFSSTYLRRIVMDWVWPSEAIEEDREYLRHVESDDHSEVDCTHYRCSGWVEVVCDE